MPYISSSGNLQGSRSKWRLSIITDFIWEILNFIRLMFLTMFDVGLKKDQLRSRRYGNDDDDRRGNRRMGGFKKGNGVASPPMAGGG